MENNDERQHALAQKEQMPLSYYPIQVLLALIGIVVGFWSWSWIEQLGYMMIGKPDLWLFFIPLALALALVNIHRSIILIIMKRDRRTSHHPKDEVM